MKILKFAILNLFITLMIFSGNGFAAGMNVENITDKTFTVNQLPDSDYPTVCGYLEFNNSPIPAKKNTALYAYSNNSGDCALKTTIIYFTIENADGGYDFKAAKAGGGFRVKIVGSKNNSEVNVHINGDSQIFIEDKNP